MKGPKHPRLVFFFQSLGLDRQASEGVNPFLLSVSPKCAAVRQFEHRLLCRSSCLGVSLFLSFMQFVTGWKIALGEAERKEDCVACSTTVYPWLLLRDFIRKLTSFKNVLCTVCLCGCIV